jgi:choice-of-anchor B domain-containing protein
VPDDVLHSRPVPSHPVLARRELVVLALAAACLLSLPRPAGAHGEKETEGGAPGIRFRLGPARCVDGRAGDFPCRRVDLLSAVPVADMGAERANDIWGWTDPATGREYALVGLVNGVGFVDISNPEAPEVVGRLPTRTASSSWRDLKVYDHHLFVVSEAAGHGLQVFDLEALRDVVEPPALFSAVADYGEFGSAHNLAVNEQSGFAYAVGTGGDACAGGLHMIDIRRPTEPRFAGCFADDGYTHDVQCVDYDGPDTDHTAKEICFAANEDTLTIVDVTDKELPVTISRTGYAGVGYTHQGWLSADQRFFLSDDESDEASRGHNTRTYVWDLRDLDAPRLAGTHEASTAAIDHNQYIRGRHAFQANYRAGLRILELTNPAAGRLRERAFFDVYPTDDDPGFNGAWSVYPYFASGVVVISSIESGLFVVRPRLGTDLKATVNGLATGRVACRDETVRRGAALELAGETSWSCRDAGLALPPGSRLRQDLRATATRRRVNGRVAGLTPGLVRCRNLESGEMVEQRSQKLRFDCAELGLPAAPGDRMLIQIWGRVD